MNKKKVKERILHYMNAVLTEAAKQIQVAVASEAIQYKNEEMLKNYIEIQDIDGKKIEVLNNVFDFIDSSTELTEKKKNNLRMMGRLVLFIDYAIVGKVLLDDLAVYIMKSAKEENAELDKDFIVNECNIFINEVTKSEKINGFNLERFAIPPVYPNMSMRENLLLTEVFAKEQGY